MNPVPPGYPVQQRRGPSCWAVGGIGCLVVIVVGIVFLIAIVGVVVKSPAGKDIGSSLRSNIKTAFASASCVVAMPAIREAILRYHDHTGNYPNKLTDLSPDYLPSGTSLHCSVDKSDDPSHVTYQYFKPTDKTPQSATLLSFFYVQTTKAGTFQQSQTITEVMTLGGQQSTNVSTPQTTGAP
jgi:hypothetical protein